MIFSIVFSFEGISACLFHARELSNEWNGISKAFSPLKFFEINHDHRRDRIAPKL
jgi:hypothetical protein